MKLWVLKWKITDVWKKTCMYGCRMFRLEIQVSRENVTFVIIKKYFIYLFIFMANCRAEWKNCRTDFFICLSKFKNGLNWSINYLKKKWSDVMLLQMRNLFIKTNGQKLKTRCVIGQLIVRESFEERQTQP